MTEPVNACENEDEVHTGYEDSGETGVNPLTGSEFQVWRCACGEKTMEVFPQYAPGVFDPGAPTWVDQ